MIIEKIYLRHSVYFYMKHLIIAILFAISFSVHSQDDKTVTLTVSAQGKTQDQAKTNA